MSDDNSNIDPQLLNDPAMAFLQGINFQPAGSAAASGATSDEDEDELPRNPGMPVPPAQQGPKSRSLEMFSRALKRRKTLSSSAEAELDIFASVSCILLASFCRL